MAGKQGDGDVWTWICLDADSKLVVSYLVGKRNCTYANAFMLDAAGRVLHSLQMTTDGLKIYLDAIENAFGPEVDYA